jgi:hypothetical protein
MRDSDTENAAHVHIQVSIGLKIQRQAFCVWMRASIPHRGAIMIASGAAGSRLRCTWDKTDRRTTPILETLLN